MTISILLIFQKISFKEPASKQHNPDVILIDLQMSGNKYAKHISKLLHICPQSKILAFPQHDREHTYRKHHSSKLLLKTIYASRAEQTMVDHIIKQVQQARFNPNSSTEI